MTPRKFFYALIAFSICIFLIVSCQSDPKIIVDPSHKVLDAKKLKDVIKENFSSIQFKQIEDTSDEAFASPDTLFLITPKKDRYLFEANKYTRDFGPEFKIPYKEICGSIKQISYDISEFGKTLKELKKNTKNSKDVKAKGSVNIETPIVKAKIEGETSLEAFTEIVESILITSGMANDKNTRIFVRGFADECIDSKNCSVGKLVKEFDGKYYYKKVDRVHKLVVSNAKKMNPETSGYESKLDEVKTANDLDQYENKDLPLLRAKFFIDDFIHDLPKKCPISKLSKDVDILEGRISNEKNNPNVRKVEVYIAIYNKK